MTTPRRRLIRSALPSPPDTSQQAQKLHAKLEKERRDFARWLARLRRAFTALDKHQSRIVRLERQITKLGGA